MIYCSSCGVANRDGSRFCNECGQRLIEMMRCPQCNFSNPASGRFCNQCGAGLQQISVPRQDAVLPDLAALTVTSVLTAAPAATLDEPLGEVDAPRLDDLLAGLPDLAALHPAISVPAEAQALAAPFGTPEAEYADALVEPAALADEEEIELRNTQADHFPLAGWADPHVGPFGAAAVPDLDSSAAIDPSAIDLSAVDLPALDLSAVDPTAIDQYAVDPLPIDLSALDPSTIDLSAIDPLAIDLSDVGLPAEPVPDSSSVAPLPTVFGELGSLGGSPDGFDLDLDRWPAPQEVASGLHQWAASEALADSLAPDARSEPPLLTSDLPTAGAPVGSLDHTQPPIGDAMGELFPDWLDQTEGAVSGNRAPQTLTLSALPLGGLVDRGPRVATGAAANLSLVRPGRASLGVAGVTAAPPMPELAAAGALFAQVTAGLQPVGAATEQRRAKQRTSTGRKAAFRLIVVLLLLVIVGLAVILAVQGGFLRLDALSAILKAS